MKYRYISFKDCEECEGEGLNCSECESRSMAEYHMACDSKEQEYDDERTERRLAAKQGKEE